MKRIEEKVKDIVEVRPFTQLHDFAADPALTLESYHFTDITADLMANWIGRVTQCKKSHGVAAALAGFRGVGKSHFLSTFAGILSQPELRSRINDEHVASVSKGLLRRHFQVAFVRRGSGADLFEELKTAVSATVGISLGELGNSPSEVLEKASEQTGDVPLILLFDTAVGRESRVSRDDGPILSEIAVAAIEFGCFACVALDDDISGADGPNSAIAASYMIDYLDPEHLFKIVDKHIFSKNRQNQALLREIYEHFRTNLQGFRWSEQRFTALYPLHPATLRGMNDVQLAALGLSGAKIRTLKAIAAAILDDGLDITSLSKSPDNVVIEKLTALHGIGPWTADIFLLFALRRADAFAPGDLALQLAVQRVFKLKNRPTPVELEKIAERWRPWRAVAARLLWADYGLARKEIPKSKPPTAAKKPVK